ncbi:YhgE/Pip domain-containing protein [Clostridium sp. CF011]|uniref:YhgE/Pip domain-containing protein n=1 Tax=Clostridium sp. CF011 TaxID=2843318 RepID=UPI001C0ADBD4|nr:YhgE/Pip domain-containing protein [Clostridium sp. CF011]MBU3091110.1 YhgE/Pip domain-containing protein [Clostridium sp. CF011]WAG68974.1 YhgE/Pip domain-containing protein [Clostridium sp. CF011]
MNFLKVAWRDISSIFKNRFIRVSVVAIIIVPLLYSLLYLDAFWDPYARIKDMPVAVVNQDRGSLKDGKKVNYGQDLVNNLKDKEAVGWRFVTKEQAEDGVKGKNYYAMFVIPEDFSQNALSSTKGKPEQATILYSANEKRNFLAAQINGKVLDQLKSELTKSMSKEYATAVFDSLFELKDGMKKASDGSKKLADGVVTAKDGTHQLKDGTGKLKSNVPEMMDGVGKLLVGSNTLTSKLGELKAQVPTMVSGVNQLHGGADKLNNGLSQLNNGLSELNNQVPSMGTGVQKLHGGADKLNNGLLELDKQVSTMVTGVQQLNDKYTTEMVPPTKELKEGAANLASGLAGTKDGSTKLNYVSTRLNGGSKELSGGYDKMKDSMSDLSVGSAKVAGGVDVLLDNSKKSQMALQQANEKLEAFLQANPDAMDNANMQVVSATLTALNKNATDENNVAMMNGLQKGAHGVAEGSKLLQEKSSDFVKGSHDFAQGAEEFSKGAGMFAEKTGEAAGGAAKISGGLNRLYDGMNGKFGNGLSELNGKMPALTGGVQKLVAGSGALSGGISALNDKIPALTGGVQKLAVGSGALSGGSGALSGGLAQFSQKMPALADGTSKLNAGSAELTKGISTLNGKLPELKDGVSKLDDGTNKLDGGMTELADGSKELNKKLADGHKDLSSSLKNDSKTMGETFSQPVVMDQKPINPVKTYGEGFTPYFIPLSLWVGALMMFFVITDKVDADIAASPASVVAGKFLSYGAIGAMQAVLASGAVMLLGLRPSNILLYFLFNIFLSNVFIAIIQCMVFLLGQAGRLISIVLLILQLTSCAGTFPIEVVPNLFKVLNPFMPFTYAVSGLREVVSGIDYGVFTKDVIVLAAMLVVFLFISISMKGHADKVQKLIQDKRDEATNITA